MVEDMFYDEISAPPPRTLPPLEPYTTSEDILYYKAYAWSLLSNSRALENCFLPLYEQTWGELLRPIPNDDDRRLIIAGQQYLWQGAVRPVPKRKPRVRGKTEAASSASEEDEFDNPDIYEEQADVAASDDSEGTVESDNDEVADPDIEGGHKDNESEEDDSDKKSDTYSAAASEGSVSAVMKKVYSGIPDESVFTIQVQRLATPPPLLIPLDNCLRDEKRAHSIYVHSGGWAIKECFLDSLTEVKRAPRHHLAKRKLDSANAYWAFCLDMNNKLRKAVSDMAKYTVIYFKKYAHASQFLAAVGSGPFWKYAVIERGDSPWEEPSKPPATRRMIKDAENKFEKLFGKVYFEIGTRRSDAELEKIRNVYFLKQEGELGYRSVVVPEGMGVIGAQKL
ncbi:hypothetical protein BT96DRAFT_1009877 [Gymnopus androsaceus JB14]|uniref:Uncharacterized protein n=1 Tax=Gymnopus androsaceus JB14 TaxID=1447944 RepID=A0A6A4GBN2_9AGAR|nr:hypothetical protein BT96DRAFT_1009877 [Gymnopus androsaceus JB14]